MRRCACNSQRGTEGIDAIIPSAAKDEAGTGTGKEFLHCPSHPGPSLIHESLGRDPASKRGIFYIAHLHRGNDRRVHCSSEPTFFFLVLEDFFFVEVLWRRCFVPDSRTNR